MRELFWSLGWMEPASRTREAMRAEAKSAVAPVEQEPATSYAPEPSAWIAALEAHAALGHGALPGRFLVARRGKKDA